MKHSLKFLEVVSKAKRNVRELSVDQVQNKISRRENFVLVDVREESEWSQGHLPDAIHIGKGVIERDIENKIVNPNTEIVLYCGGGYRSALAAESIQKMGYTNVFSMDGGYREWAEKKLPISR
jgi:rhodanese-related sulfurtransferase